LRQYGLPVKRRVGKNVFLACRFFDWGKGKFGHCRLLGLFDGTGRRLYTDISG